MKKIGILGGTFDPPHIGHLIIAEEVYQELGLDEVWFMPSNEPPHKSNAMASGTDRLEMVEAAIQGNAHFRAVDFELKREGKSYTYDTIYHLKERYPSISIYFIIGGDMVEYLPRWHAIDKLLELVHFVGVNRKGHPLSSPYPVLEVEVPLIEVSSTDIRNRMKEGRNATYLLPDEVIHYIKGNHLYET
ncbi:nicotinate-nucleotide adenylyltransferase [Thalassobacillus hwangdonensis]|uniref:Probable nicotinate-nucleotide adenylyltransferase n=1 Tax=Thalassobacillus hwangdonensis TaxID=546108 RepID=A0ABW3KYY1_9BACI